jgi:uncharacterized paraquat-inducible protein A
MTKGEIAWKMFIAALYLLAAPIYAAKWLLKAEESFSRMQTVRQGFVVCPHCHFQNPLDILAQCRRCARAEFGSRLFCTNCKQVTKAFPCDRCTATIQVL